MEATYEAQQDLWMEKIRAALRSLRSSSRALAGQMASRPLDPACVGVIEPGPRRERAAFPPRR